MKSLLQGVNGILCIIVLIFAHLLQLGVNWKETLASFLIVGCKLKYIFMCFN